MAKIMLVEDDNNLREIYGARLLAEGHEIVTAKDGEEALAIAVKEKPELIISDVMMPKISGFDMLDILRNAPETKHTKVIMMTALSQTEDKARADSLGADRYLVKSQVTLEDVARVVRDVLEGKTEEPAPAAVASTDAPEEEAEAETPVTETPLASETMTPEFSVPPAEPAVETPAPETELPTMPIDTDSAESSPAMPEVPAVVAPDVVESPVPNAETQPAEAIMPEVNPVTEMAIPGLPAEPTMPEINPVVDPSLSSSMPSADPVTATTDDVTTATTDPITAPTTDDQSVESPAEPAIKVELPTMPAPVTEEPETTEANQETQSATAEPVVPEQTPENLNVGPNLAQALMNESGTDATTEPESATVVPEVQPIIPEPVATVPSEPNFTEPSSAPVMPTPDVEAPIVNPSTPEVITPTSIPSPEPVTDEAPADQPTENPLQENSGSGVKKKIIIQPINDITKGPDLDALVQKEQASEAVPTPSANTVIAPGAEPTPPAQASQPNEHDVISL